MAMDAAKLLQLQDAVLEQQKLEKQLRFAAVESERKELQQALGALRRQVAQLQKNLMLTYNTEYVRCRDLGHRWTEREKFIEKSDLRRVLGCQNCDSERHETITKYGDLRDRRYKHSEGYLMPVHTGSQTLRYTKAFWRGISYMQVASAESSYI